MSTLANHRTSFIFLPRPHHHLHIPLYSFLLFCLDCPNFACQVFLVKKIMVIFVVLKVLEFCRLKILPTEPKIIYIILIAIQKDPKCYLLLSAESGVKREDCASYRTWTYNSVFNFFIQLFSQGVVLKNVFPLLIHL